jgi:hypothetical protein
MRSSTPTRNLVRLQQNEEGHRQLLLLQRHDDNDEEEEKKKNLKTPNGIFGRVEELVLPEEDDDEPQDSRAGER